MQGILFFKYRYLVFVCRNKMCKTPPYPDDGSYLTNGVAKPEGSEVFPFSVIEYKCKPGYTFDQEQAVSVCYEGKWVPEITCKRE